MEDQNLEKIRYYKGTWDDFFTYWKKRGVKADPYKDMEFQYPIKKKQNTSSLPHQDFGTYEKSKMNKLHESFKSFKNGKN